MLSAIRWTASLIIALSATICFCAAASENNAPNADPIYFMDLTDLAKADLNDPKQVRKAWDTLHLAASVQGIVNRQKPTLILRLIQEPDDFWFAYSREKGNWLADRPVKNITSIEDLLNTFQKSLAGAVAYREQYRPTSNLASTIAGVEDRVCLRYDESPDSIYHRVLATKLPLAANIFKLFNDDGSTWFPGKQGDPIRDTAIPSTGSPKCDAYLWALHRYGKDGGVSPKYLAYYIDTYWMKAPAGAGLFNSTLSNHDFFISQKAFFFDLGGWEDETPVDDQQQPLGTDLKTLKAILRSTYDRNHGEIGYMGGFVPWAWKYTDADKHSKHGAVDSEWQMSKVISAYNVALDADALGMSGLVNASFYQHFPLQERYPQNPRPTIEDLKKKGFITADGRVAPYAYVMFYVGDYDSAAWLSTHVPMLWRDPQRGSIPCNWAFNPNLDRRCPQVMHYARTHQTAQDWFIAGDCGAGYLNPGMLSEPRLDPELPDGTDAWVRYNLPYYRRYDLSITGFIIDGFAPAMNKRVLDGYEKFSPDGIIAQKVPLVSMHNKMPCAAMRLDVGGAPQTAGEQIAGLVDDAKRPSFLPIRTILMTPSWHKEAMACAEKAPRGDRLRFVDAYTFFLLMKTEVEQSGPRP